MRTPIIAGNWKMHMGVKDAVELVKGIINMGQLPQEVETVVCPPYVSLNAVSKELKDTQIKLGAQNMHWEVNGAYTGEVSPTMLKELGCEYVIIGHSERRTYFSETDEMVNRKVIAALKHNLKPIICVGENLEQREKGETETFVTNQVKNALSGLDAKHAQNVVLAYEPIWAIGTGKSADSKEANRVISIIRKSLEELFGSNGASIIRIQYGGSVKPHNIKEFMDQPEIDGALVGGASLKPQSFYDIVTYNA